MLPFARRFRRKAGLIALLAVVLVSGALVAAIILTTDPDASASIVAWAVTAALAGGVGAFAASSARREIAMREVAGLNPDGLVYLARRQPALISDLETYLGSSPVASAVADRWVVALAGTRGLSAWSVGRRSQELLLIPWTDLGSLEVTRLENGRAGVAVDVKPFATPLLVSVGYSAFGVLTALDRAGVAEVVAASDAFRPYPVERLP
jgi:hypothetical protein